MRQNWHCDGSSQPRLLPQTNDLAWCWSRIALNAVAGAAASIVICTRVFVGARGPSEVDWIDWLAYGVSPVLAYVGAFAAAVLLFGNSMLAPDLLAGSVLVLLVANIRAWDITLVMARRRNASPQ